MRRPTRTHFHHSDLGGAFVAFARGFHECDEGLRHEADSTHPLFSPTRHQRSSMLIDALRHRRPHPVPSSRPSEPSERWAGTDNCEWGYALKARRALS
jgi:hypothetical protein